MPIFGWFSATRAAQSPSLVTNYIQVSTGGLVQVTAVFTSQFARPRNPADNVPLGEITQGSSSELIVLNPPSVPTDVANKEYVDAVGAGLDPKESCRAASTADIDLATGGLLTIDTTVLVDGDRALVKNQAIPAENGVYLVRAGAWERAPDFDGSPTGIVSGGASTFVETGTQAGNGYVVVFDGPVDVGVDAITWVLHTGGGSTLHVGETITPDGVDLGVSPGGNPVAGAADSTTLNHYQSATISLTHIAPLIGASSPISAVVTRAGNQVVMRMSKIGGFVATATESELSYTGIPAWARPAVDLETAANIQMSHDATLEQGGFARVGAAGTLTFHRPGHPFSDFTSLTSIEVGSYFGTAVHFVLTWTAA